MHYSAVLGKFDEAATGFDDHWENCELGFGVLDQRCYHASEPQHSHGEWRFEAWAPKSVVECTEVGRSSRPARFAIVSDLVLLMASGLVMRMFHSLRACATSHKVTPTVHPSLLLLFDLLTAC
jgi:hypothetical protein